MCGIAGYYLRRPSKGLNHDRLIDALLDGIDWRGGEATGMALFGADGLLDHQRAGADARVFSKHRRSAPRETRIALLHTRLATQGHPAFVENNHPVVNQGVFVTHNGHISNDRELWQKIGPMKQKADVDSEAIPAIIAQHGWENAVKALEEIEGSMAIAAVHQDYPAELLLAKGEQSPLIYAYTDTILVWASTEIALMNAWGEAIGTPPKARRLKQLKLGDFLKVKDGKIEMGKFEVAFDWMYGYRKYNTTSSSTTNVTVIKPRGTKETKAVSTKTVDEWLREKHEEQWEKANLSEIADEIDATRKRTDEILGMEPGWWDKPGLLREFNDCWDRIRALRDLYEERAWEAIDGTDEDERGTLVQCASCYEQTPLEEMNGTTALYCDDCYYYHLDHNKSCDPSAGELQWKTIAPGTEIMVRVDPETGEEVIA